MSSSIDGIFSVRLVIADFYMEKPILGLDPCYSEFRGKEIKRVPIIRIFGSNANGQKTCMHVHGVFPYFYIPYEQKEFETPGKAFYQIATSVDRAINISLGQGSSTAQHVFKVQLVKGIPFYGYHRVEHQLLKIYMFNPRFVRRAANLLQGGAILNKNFHPFESHVPYILQFMIDYNLYGMSYLHVPLEVLKFRKPYSNDDDDNDDSDVSQIAYSGIKAAQILSTTLAPKLANSALEVDVGSHFILNRFQLVAKDNSTHSNPGIEAIWHDERVRRQKLTAALAADEAELKTIPPLEVPVSQERVGVEPTESEVFHRTALLSKLLSLELSMSLSGGDGIAASQADQTLNNSLQSNALIVSVINPKSSKEQKRTFNLRKILANAIYPEECSQNENLTNASFIENHLSNSSLFQVESSNSARDDFSVSSAAVDDAGAHGDSVFLDDTVVDEELVFGLMSQSQQVPLDATLRDEDVELLNILQHLEEDNGDEHKIDLDSTLAPLSQAYQDVNLSPELLDKQTMAAAVNQQMSDSDTETEANDEQNVQDFSIILDDIDELILKLTHSQLTPEKQNLPQVDGSDDVLRTPIKTRSTSSKSVKTPPRTPKTPRNTRSSPRRSPRTPSSIASRKYAPLPLKITNRFGERNNQLTKAVETTPAHCTEVPHLKIGVSTTKSAKMTLSKKLALVKLRRVSMPSVSNIKESPTVSRNKESKTATPIRRSRNTANLDKTHITCALTPRRTSKRLLKVYNVDENAALKTVQDIKVAQITRKVNAKQKIPTKQNKSILLENVPTLIETHSKMEHKIESNLETPVDNQDKIETVTNLDKNETVANLDKNETVVNKTLDVNISQNNASLEENGSSEDCDEIAASDTEDVDKSINRKRLRRSIHLAQRLQTTKKRTKISTNVESESSKAAMPTKIKSTYQSPSMLSAEAEQTDADDWKIQSFYESSFFELCSPISCSASPLSNKEKFEELRSDRQLPTPTTSACDTPNSHLTIPETTNSSNSCRDNVVALTPLLAPPTHEEVLESCKKLDIHEYEFQKPYYSNPDDITKQKEVGYIVLQIPGQKLNDRTEFASVLGSQLQGLTEWRNKKFLEMNGPTSTASKPNAQRMREYFAKQKRMIISPQICAPSRYEAKLWLKARELLKNEAASSTYKIGGIEEDSPIKVQRQKVSMMLNEGMCGGAASDGDDDMDCSSRSITLTPLTPALLKASTVDESQHITTPLTTISKDNLSLLSCKRDDRRKGRVKRAKLSLNVRLKAAMEVEQESEEVAAVVTPLSILIENSDSLKGSCDSVQGTSLNDSSVSSQTVLTELRRSSFVKQLQVDTSAAKENSFGLANATLDNTFGFKVNLENLQQAKADIECNYLTTMVLELFVPTRDNLLPNPNEDEIRCIFYAVENSMPVCNNSDALVPQKVYGYIIVNASQDLVREGQIHGIDADVAVQVVRSEIEAFETLVELCLRWDADIYAGYEIEMSSWGYIIERAKKLSFNIAPLLSRVPTEKVRETVDEEREHFTDLDVEMKLCGRILLDVWRLMRSEIALTSYTFENVMYHIMHRRTPLHSFRDLSAWFAAPCSRWIVIEYYLERVHGTLALLAQLDLIGRTSEMAKLIGIQFYEVLSRGSQFRVESMMLRIAKPKNIVPLSPSVQQRAHMRAPEYLALILEPQSRFYVDPVIVLDFQSLYPSMIIAYNYCFSTCLGRVEHLGHSTPFEFGASQLRVSPKMLRKLLDQDLINISPGGVVFVKSSVREGILPRMLVEILDTRQMVKQSMKLHKNNSALQRVLHSRQLGLKLMANVTYGYTAANFSGRMPAVEVGDSVVAKGRETLERAIKLVEANEKWRVKVVYGDTDSLFVLVPGRDRAEAFRIGEEIVEAVTKTNPQPVKLKLEKVYQPCILQTKKRYVGYMYETADQLEPVYEAKGIETVRRDGCPAVAKMLEKVLRILFETADVSQVKQYVCRQFTKLLSGRANLQDLIFAKEFRGLNGYKPTACVPALELTRKWLKSDPRRIPRSGERVPFVIVNEPPGLPLIRLVRSPHEVLADEGLKINALYYITKAIIPPLNRCLLLIGADVHEWFASLPRKLLLIAPTCTANELVSSKAVNQIKKSTISQYFSVTNCVIDCGRQTKQGICEQCERDQQKTFLVLHSKMAKIERGYQLTQQMCQACCGRLAEVECSSLDCPVLYVLEVKRRELKQIEYFQKLLTERF